MQKKLDALFEPWNRSDAPGLVVGVARAGQPVYRRGFGLASLEHGVANSAATRMRIGSTSKHFTALAALLLAEESRLDLDAPTRHYLPELTGPAGAPTLRQLMTHSGGLRDPHDLPGILLHRGFAANVPDGMGLEVSQRFTGANFAPGERMIYCNNGYHLLSLIIERVSGQELGAFLRERILAPLGLRATELLRSDLRIVPGIATFHLPQADGGWRRGIFPTEELLGAGGIVSTVDDMLAWLAHLRGAKKVGSQQTWAELLEHPRYASGASGSYCLGLIREACRGVEIMHHAGTVHGGTCQMLTVPAHALDVIVMCNRMDMSAPALALNVVDAVLGDTVLAAAETSLPGAVYGPLLGRWYAPGSHRVFGVMLHRADPGNPTALALAIHQQPVGMLRPVAGALRVSSPAHGAVDLPVPEVTDAPPGELTFRDNGHAESFLRLPEDPPTATELAPGLVGRYRYTELDVEVALVLEANALYLDLLPPHGISRFRLEPFSSAVFGMALTASAPLPYPCLGTLAVERQGNTVSGLWLNSARTRNLWLERLSP